MLENLSYKCGKGQGVMLKFYVDSVLINPYSGEPEHNIIEVAADVPKLEKVLFEDRRSSGCEEYRKILDVKQERDGSR